jgi:DNA-binding NarL/FixJ family response regulator
MRRILLADDHGLYRKGLQAALLRAFSDAALVAVDSFEAALACIERTPNFDLLIIDLHLPRRLSGEDLLHLSKSHRDMRVAVLSASESRTDILECLACGVHGYISKGESEDEIISGINHILNGQIYVTPRLISIDNNGSLHALKGNIEFLAFQMSKLTQRQKEVFAQLSSGKSNKEIAQELHIAEATVKIHAAAVMRALGAKNRAVAALMAQELLGRSR